MTTEERLEARYAFAARWSRGKRVWIAGGSEAGRATLARVCREIAEEGPADLVVAVEGGEWRPAAWRRQAPQLVAWAAHRPNLGELYPYVRLFSEVQTEVVVPSLPEAPELSMFAEGAEGSGWVAVCSPHPQPESPPFLYLPADRNVLRERERHITLLRGELKQKDQWLEEAKRSLAALQQA